MTSAGERANGARVTYEWTRGGMTGSELLEECSELYGNHYGYWSKSSSASPGGRIRLSAGRIRDWFASENADIYLARSDGRLIGYAIAVTVKVPDYGVVAWVTQLVVHTSFRNQGVAKTLLFSIWGLTDHFAWGITTASPYAVRALEKATRRRCSPLRIARNKKKLLAVGSENVPYIDKTTELIVDPIGSRINTKFQVDHSRLEEMAKSVTSANVGWVLGEIDEGWEWFAFTFHDQEQISLSGEEIEKMIAASDQVTRQAYSRMQPSVAHAWMQHTDEEAELIMEYCQLQSGMLVIDFGCGTGRHCIALAKMGMRAIGVDYVEARGVSATKNAEPVGEVAFVTADCRTVSLEQADAVVCLYDVVGSYADAQENLRILENVANQLREGGMALLSVMNYELTEFSAKYRFKFSEQPDKLLELLPSQTMETSGDVFNPDYYALDVDTQVVYRREQFLAGDSLPVELVVRDRRFRKREIEDMCQSAGLEVIWSRYVSAANWRIGLDRHDSSAKEILVLCSKARAKAP